MMLLYYLYVGFLSWIQVILRHRNAPRPPWGTGGARGIVRYCPDLFLREILLRPKISGIPDFNPKISGLTNFRAGFFWILQLLTGKFSGFSHFKPKKIRPEKFRSKKDPAVQTLRPKIFGRKKFRTVRA